MSRSNRQLLRLVQELIRQIRNGQLSARWIVGIVVVAAAYLLLQPTLQRHLGMELPGLSDFIGVVATEPTIETPPPGSAETSTDDDLERILQTSRPETYVSPAGLQYTRGSPQGHRLKHLMTHAQDQPDRPGQHGVFQSSAVTEVVALVDEAYQQALEGKNTRVEREGERTIYTVDLGRQIGYIGGKSGNRRGLPVAQQLRLVLAGKNVVTAFPYRP